MLFEPCGDLKKDYGAYCETLRLTEREEVYRSILTSTELEEVRRQRRLAELAQHPVEQASVVEEAEVKIQEAAPPPPPPPPPPKEATRGSSRKAKNESSRSSTGRKSTNGRDVEQGLEAEDVALALAETPVLTFVKLRHPTFCINQRDMTPLCRAMPHCPSLVSVEFVGSGLSIESYLLLTEALYKCRRVASVSVDFNCTAKPGFYVDPTVLVPTPQSSSALMSPPASPVSATNVAAAAAAAAAAPAADQQPVMTLDLDKATKRVASPGKKSGRKGAKGPEEAEAAPVEAAALPVVDEPGVVYLKPTEFAGLHLIPTALEEQIKEEREKKGKVDPKKQLQLQAQQEALQQFNDAHRIKLPRSWHGMLFTNVRHLSLRGNGIDDEVVAEMAYLMLRNPRTQLISLNLWGNRITDTGAMELAKVLRGNRTLRSLDVGHNDIGDAGLLAMTDAFRMQEFLAMDELAAYRQKVLNRPDATEEERSASSSSMPSNLPSYHDLYYVWHALRHPPVVEEKGRETGGGSGKRNAGKNKNKVDAPPTVSRPSAAFDRDCIRMFPAGGEPGIRAPGNTVLEMLNLGDNTRISLEGAKEACRWLAMHEPSTEDDMIALGAKAMEKTQSPNSPRRPMDPPLVAPNSASGLGRSHGHNLTQSFAAPPVNLVGPPERHCAGLRLRTFVLLTHRYDSQAEWRAMNDCQMAINTALNGWAVQPSHRETKHNSLTLGLSTRK